MAGKTWIEKIGSRMFVTVFFNLGFYFLNKKESLMVISQDINSRI